MVEWHVTPDYIVSNWTDELLDLMVDKLNKRKAKEVAPMGDRATGSHRVSDSQLFQMAGIKVRGG